MQISFHEIRRIQIDNFSVYEVESSIGPNYPVSTCEIVLTTHEYDGERREKITLFGDPGGLDLGFPDGSFVQITKNPKTFKVEVTHHDTNGRTMYNTTANCEGVKAENTTH